MSIGDNIRAARRACNMTQAELAEKVGLSRPTIALYEAGKRELTASQIVPFARVLDTSPLFLLEGTRGVGGTPLSLPFLPSSTTRSGKFGSGFSRPTLPPVPKLLFCFVLFNLWVLFAVHICTANSTANKTAKRTARPVSRTLSTALSTAYSQLIHREEAAR